MPWIESLCNILKDSEILYFKFQPTLKLIIRLRTKDLVDVKRANIKMI